MITSLEKTNHNNLDKINNLEQENSKYFDKLTEY